MDKATMLIELLAGDLNTNIDLHNLCRKWGVEVVEAEDEDGWWWTDQLATLQRLAQHVMAEDDRVGG